MNDEHTHISTFGRRGREGTDHRVAKREMYRIFSEVGYPVRLLEYKNCDLFIGSPSLDAAVEVENSVKNVLPNIERNFSNSIHFNLLVCPSFRILRDIAQKIHKDLPQHLWDKVGITTVHSLRLLVPPKISESCDSEK